MHVCSNFVLQKISPKTLGRLVLDSIERSVDPITKEIQVLRFLNNLYISARDYERLVTENQIHSALRAVEVHTKTLEKIEETGLSTASSTVERRGHSQEPAYATIAKKPVAKK